MSDIGKSVALLLTTLVSVGSTQRPQLMHQSPRGDSHFPNSRMPEFDEQQT